MTETPPPPHGSDPLEPDAARPARAPEVVDPYGPLDPVDEAASAALDELAPDDGASPVDPARVDARVQELARVTALLAEPVRPPEASVVDTHIAAALDALAAGAATTSAPTDRAPGPAVARLADRRRRPAVGRWLAVAAAAVVVALAIPVVQSLSKSTSSSNDTASVAAGAADSNDAEATSGAQPSVTPQRGGFDATSTTTSGSTDATLAPVTGSDLGTAETPQALTALVQEAAPPDTSALSSNPSAEASSTTVPSTRSLTHCDTANRATHPDLGDLRYTATATYQSIPVEIAVYDVGGSSRLIATAADDCRVLLDQLIP